MRIAARRGLVLSNEDAARHAPSEGIGGEARRAPAFHVTLNLSPDYVRPYVGRRDPGPAAGARRVRSTGVRPDRGDGDGRMGPLQRADRDADPDARIERALRRGPVELAFDLVRRRFAPDPAHVIERLLGLAPAVRRKVPNGL